MNKIIVANWKMAPQTLEEAKDLYRSSDGAIVCPPFVYLEELAKISSEAALGAQDIALSEESAQTGEISAEMLKEFNVRYVIIGHSERRWKLGESDEIVNKKLKMALIHNLTPIVCIGERSREDDFKKFLADQTIATLKGLTAEEIGRCLIAYEPVWAISTMPGSHPDTPESALESVEIIRSILTETWGMKAQNLPKVLYGGSVTSKNVADFLRRPEFSGVLIGQASTDKEEFMKILTIVSEL